MQHDLTIDNADRLLRQIIRSVLTAAPTQAVYRACPTHAAWSAHFDHLLVYESVEWSRFSGDEVRDMVLRFKMLDDEYHSGAASKAAAVMDSHLLAGILSFYGHISAPEPVTPERVTPKRVMEERIFEAEDD